MIRDKISDAASLMSPTLDGTSRRTLAVRGSRLLLNPSVDHSVLCDSLFGLTCYATLDVAPYTDALVRRALLGAFK